MTGRPRVLNYEAILQLHNNGKTVSEISKILEYKTAGIRVALRSYGLKPNHPPAKYNLQEVEKEILSGVDNNHLLQEFDFPSLEAVHLFLKSQNRYDLNKIVDGRATRWKGHQNQLHNKIIRLAEKGHYPAQIARDLQISKYCVRAALRKTTVKYGKGHRVLKYSLPTQELVDLYQKGYSCKEIGELFQVDAEYVRVLLNKNDVEMRVGKATGHKNPQWKGGRTQTMHYYRRLCYEIVAICLRKPLKKGAIIHHADENPKNNYPTNLLIFERAKDHARYHQLALKNLVVPGSIESIQMAKGCGATELPLPNDLSLFEEYKDHPIPSNKKVG